ITWTKAVEHTAYAYYRYYGFPYQKIEGLTSRERGYVGLRGGSTNAFETKFKGLKVNDHGHHHTIEDAFRAYGAAAGIHDFSFDSSPYAQTTASGWDIDAELNVNWNIISETNVASVLIGGDSLAT